DVHASDADQDDRQADARPRVDGAGHRCRHGRARGILARVTGVRRCANACVIDRSASGRPPKPGSNMVELIVKVGVVAATLFAAVPILAAASSPAANVVVYRTISIDGLSIFYREAGSKDAPTLLLLHGFPSSSRMFDALFPLLSSRYHLIAPDYPGFGHS